MRLAGGTAHPGSARWIVYLLLIIGRVLLPSRPDRLVHVAGVRLGERPVLPDRHLRAARDRPERRGRPGRPARPRLRRVLRHRRVHDGGARRPSAAGTSGRSLPVGIVVAARCRASSSAPRRCGCAATTWRSSRSGSVRSSGSPPNNLTTPAARAASRGDPAPAVAAGRRVGGVKPAYGVLDAAALLLPAAGRDHPGDHRREAAGAQPGRPVLGGDPGGRGRGRADGRADVQVQDLAPSPSAPRSAGWPGRLRRPDPPRSPR